MERRKTNLITFIGGNLFVIVVMLLIALAVYLIPQDAIRIEKSSPTYEDVIGVNDSLWRSEQ